MKDKRAVQLMVDRLRWLRQQPPMLNLAQEVWDTLPQIISALDCAVAQEAKPVAWQVLVDGHWLHITEAQLEGGQYGGHQVRPLYTAPHTTAQEPQNLRGALQDCVAFLRGDISGFSQRMAIIKEAETALNTTAQQAGSSIDHHQQRGQYADIITEALQTYDDWMLDDDYEFETILRKIVNRMRERFTPYTTVRAADDMPSTGRGGK